MKKTFISLAFFLLITTGQIFAQLNNECYTHSGHRLIKIQKGYINISEINLGVGLGDVTPSYDTNQLGFSMVNGYHFSPDFMAGVGLGLQSYNGGTLGGVYLDTRYYFQIKCVDPFIMTDVGMKFRVSGDDANAGLFLFPAAGVRIHVCRKLALTFAAGPYAHWVKPDGGRSTFISIKFGAEFY